MGLGCRFYILLTQRCWWGCKLFLVFGCILYRHNFVGKNTYSIYTKMGATLPVLKNEIKDFFFARLGTGRTSQNRRATSRFRMYVIGEFISVGKICTWYFFGRYCIRTTLLVVIHIS